MFAAPTPAVPPTPTDPAIIVVMNVSVAAIFIAPPALTLAPAPIYASVVGEIGAIDAVAATPASSPTPSVAVTDSIVSDDVAITVTEPPAATLLFASI